MLAIDTNIVVRLITDDDAAQTAKVRKLFTDHQVFVATTVMLETAWVLGSAYRFSRAQVAEALILFTGLANVRLEDDQLVATALAWLAQGMDFADALHLAKSNESETFVTFDRDLSRTAKRLGVGPVDLM